MENGKERLLEYISEQTYIELSKEENITREDLNKWCKELEIDELSNDKSTLIYIKYLISKGISLIDFYNRFKDKAYGIHPSRFSNKFKVNNYQRRKMIETGFIKVAYYKEEEIFPGRFEKVPFFNPKWYFDINMNYIEKWRTENIKGYGKEQLKLDI
ncbi:MAG: hypothetical protein E7C50_00510 [Clostridium sp.]|uniref:hypothetical protein n=1 Tax=Clostridium sp. TaxID=1506 RepID=UPI002900B591|nr:hypothetical protein [Clostridium sp.]MDU2673075.1 hypothetical protein [Clostridium sp.]MDU2680341.1 hypothetical protein [Clostridium sp.]